MKQAILPIAMSLALLSAGNLAAGPEVKESSKSLSALPKSPEQLIKYLTGTTWRLQSGTGEYFSEGTLVFKDKGLVEHLYKDGVLHKKRWGVTSDLRVIWGGKLLRVCRFSSDYKTFQDNRNETTGRRVIREEGSRDKVTSSD